MNEERSATMNTILRVNDLVTTFRYGKKDIPVVNGVSFEVHEGEIRLREKRDLAFDHAPDQPARQNCAG